MKKKILLTMILFFIMNVFNNLGHPITPSFVRYLGIKEYMFGIFFATMSLGMMIAAPIWGSLGDGQKNRKYIALGLAIYGFAQLGFGLSHNQYIMVLFRFIGGIGISAPMTLFISLIIKYSKENRIKNLAILSALSTLGSALGYQIGGFLGDSVTFSKIINTESYENIFILQAFSMLVLSVFVLIFIKDYKVENSVSNKRNPFKALLNIKTLDFKLLLFLISLTLITMGSTNISKYIDVYFNDLNLSTTQLGNHVLVTGIISVLTAVLIVPLVSRLKKQLNFIVIIQVLSSIIIFYVFRSNNFILAIYTVYNVYIIFKAIYLPMEQNYISKHADENTIGTITGIRQSFVSIGNVIGPLFGGILYNLKPLLVFDISAILFLIGGIILIFIIITENKKIR